MSDFIMSNAYQKSSKTRKTYKNKLILRPMKEGYTLGHAQKEAYNGGRSLRAIWSNSSLKPNQKLVLLCLASHLNFKNTFKAWQKISAKQIASETQFGIRTIHSILADLVKNGYLLKKQNFSSKTFLQEENSYCLSDKLFDEHVIYLQKSFIPKHDEHVKEFKQQKFAKKSYIPSAKPAEAVSKACNPALQDSQAAIAKPADVFPLVFSPNFLPLNNSMCGENKSHTKNEHKNSKNLKQASIIVCELLKHKLNKRFIPNFECEGIIERSISKLNIIDIKIILDFCKEAISNPNYKKINSYENIEVIFIQELESFINDKNYISNFRISDHKEIKTEIIKAEPLAENKTQTVIEEYPEPFKSWFKTLNETTKNTIRKEIKIHGRVKFFNLILPSVRAYKSFIEQLDSERRAA
nr:hypothetical protein GTC16762_33100 [Pigmentibacter ruber]